MVPIRDALQEGIAALRIRQVALKVVMLMQNSALTPKKETSTAKAIPIAPLAGHVILKMDFLAFVGNVWKVRIVQKKSPVATSNAHVGAPWRGML